MAERRPNLAFKGSLTGRQWRTVEAIEGRGDYKLVEVARLDAVMRMLVDSGDMTPMAVRQIRLSLGIDPAVARMDSGRVSGGQS